MSFYFDQAVPKGARQAIGAKHKEGGETKAAW